jgi:uncharacterized protein (UPF0218 family)/phosphopantetheine adenylyltransferase
MRDNEYMKLHTTVLGGTFDRLHIGHQDLLHRAFQGSQSVTIGLTTEILLKDKILSNAIQSYNLREKLLQNFQLSHYPSIPLTIIPLFDIYGTSVTDASFSRLIVTKDSLANGKKINEKRLAIHNDPLELLIIPLKEDVYGEIISSSRIREGQINAQGQLYQDLFKQPLFLPFQVRQQLSKPFGILYKNTQTIISEIHRMKPILVITVGDVVSDSFIQENYIPNIAVIDFKTKRNAIFHQNRKFDVANKASTIQPEFSHLFLTKLNEVITKKTNQIITIEGEEDLLVLPAILLSPLGSVVLYGQPNEGVVLVEVTEIAKQKARGLVEQFKEKALSDKDSILSRYI